MKHILPILLILSLLCGCGAPAQPPAAEETAPVQTPIVPVLPEASEIPYESRFTDETVIKLTDTGMDVTGPNSMTVFGSHDIIYYEDKDVYESGNPYKRRHRRHK